MYPPRFDYLAPTSLEEVVAALGERDGDAKLMAGGQSLIPLLKLRITSPSAIVDLARVPGLDGLEEHDGGLRIGALVRHRDAERSELCRGRFGPDGHLCHRFDAPVKDARGVPLRRAGRRVQPGLHRVERLVEGREPRRLHLRAHPHGELPRLGHR